MKFTLLEPMATILLPWLQYTSKEFNFPNLLFTQCGMESGNETIVAKSPKGTYVALVSIPRMSSVK